MSLKAPIRGGIGGVKVGRYWKMKQQEWFFSEKRKVRLFFISNQAITLTSVLIYAKAREHLFPVNVKAILIASLLLWAV